MCYLPRELERQITAAVSVETMKIVRAMP